MGLGNPSAEPPPRLPTLDPALGSLVQGLCWSVCPVAFQTVVPQFPLAMK